MSNTANRVIFPRYPIEGQQGDETAVEHPNADEQTTASDRKRKMRPEQEKKATATKTSWKEHADRIVQEKVTPMWTWNAQRATASFPRENWFMEILKVISENKVEVRCSRKSWQNTPQSSG